MIFDRFRKKPLEKRATGSGFTAEIMTARESWISGRRGVAELTGTVQSCVSLWEGGLGLADIDGTDLLTPSTLSIMARGLALRGESLFVIGDDRLIPCTDWEVSTRDGMPVAYRATVPEANGGRSRTLLAAEVVHVRIGTDPAAPWAGQAPLRRAAVSAGFLHAVEDALREVYENAPLGSQIVPFPETPDIDKEALGRGFRGRRGAVLLRESVTVTAAGGPSPQTDWRPSDTSPDLQKSMTVEALEAAQGAVMGVYGVLPGLMAKAAQGPLVREAQRHLAQWTLQPVASLIGEELAGKLGAPISLDVMRPLQAFDAGGRARALSAIVQTMAAAKEAGLSESDVGKALSLVDWKQD